MPGPIYFAWAGGAIEEQVTLVTNGTTQGAILQTTTIVGDTDAGTAQLVNIASTETLDADALHHITGQGVDAYFIFSDNVLSGLPGSINLTSAPSDTVTSGTFTVRKSIPIGTVLATMQVDSSGVTLVDVPDLAPGTYGIFGSGIGYTTVPIATYPNTTYTSGGYRLDVGSCFLNYSGGGNGHLFLVAATPHTIQITDAFGKPAYVTVFTIGHQDVYATQSGQLPVTLTGFPTTNPLVITDIPSSALMGLTPGLIYNITGNGVRAGTTFVAPSGTATSITLDLPATASALNSILTITGPRTPNAPFDPAVHNRFDEDLLGFTIEQEEGGFATLTADIKNPGIGLLAMGRYLWCWLSWDNAWSPDGGNTPDLVPLFNGRLIGVPKLQAGEIVQLQFLARPDDFNAQKVAWVNELEVLPYYDPVWIAQNDSIDVILETYSALWHIDRATLAVSISDILEGEDGTVDVGEDLSLYDHFTLSYGQPPLVAVELSGTVTWQQQAAGHIDVTQPLVAAFWRAGSAFRWAFAADAYGGGGGGLIQILVGEGLKGAWPAPGTTIGGGWSLSAGNDHSNQPLCYIVDHVTNAQIGYNVTFEGQLPPPNQFGQTTDQTNVTVALNQYATFTASFPMNVYRIRMNLDYRANRKRTETINAVLTAGVQLELSDSAESDREAISLSSDFPGQAVDPDGVIPIGNVANRSYFQTSRGNASFQYLLLAARAKLRARARSVDITFAVPWQNAINITLRHSVNLTDRRLPGGVAEGKVKSYKLSYAANGICIGEFTVGCSIGTAEGIEPQTGVNSYVVDGYLDPPYQIVSGAQIVITSSDLAYETLDDFMVLDDGLDLTNLTVEQAVNECIVVNGNSTKFEALSVHQTYPTFGLGMTPLTIVSNLSTTVTLDLKPLQGSEFHTTFYPALTQLQVPKTIDLSAPTAGD